MIFCLGFEKGAFKKYFVNCFLQPTVSRYFRYFMLFEFAINTIIVFFRAFLQKEMKTLFSFFLVKSSKQQKVKK